MFDDFKGITNHEAYKKVFIDRMMAPHPTDPKKFLGNTQREDFLPHLQNIVASVPPSAEVSDFGCGAGEIVDLALHQLRSATIHLEEPNPLLMEAYKKRLKSYPHLKQGLVYEGYIEDFYRPRAMPQGKASSAAPVLATAPQFKADSQDLALAIHMIYHITPFQVEGNAEQDVQDMMTFLYRVLKPGGKLFLVYADDEACTTAKASVFYFQQKNELKKLNQLRKIQTARTQLLKKGRIADVLRQSFPAYTPVLTTHTTSSWIFGKTERDMAILCLLAELGETDDRPFDVEKLEICQSFINRNRAEIQMSMEQRDMAQKGMWRFFQPQVVLCLEKKAVR